MESLTERADRRNTSLAAALAVSLLLLLLIGLVSLYSASYDKAMRIGLPPDYFFRRQALFAAAALAAAFLLYVLPLGFLKACIPLITAGSLVLMLLTLFTPLGETQLGARRWISIGPIGFQPSELVKLSSILFLANYFSSRRRLMHNFTVTVIPAAAVGLFAGLILLQRDFSTTVVYLAVCFTLFLFSGTPLSYLLYLMGFAGFPSLLLMMSEPYRLHRIAGFLFRDIDPSGINYQVNRALGAVASGRAAGRGLGSGIYKLGLLPEVQSDFIFASFVEETGFIGGTAVVLLFCTVGVLGFLSALRLREQDPFLSHVGIGASALIVFQAAMNIGVNLGVLPATGIPLPFFSQGLSSLLLFIGIGGLLCRAAAASEHIRIEEEPEESRKEQGLEVVLYE